MINHEESVSYNNIEEITIHHVAHSYSTLFSFSYIIGVGLSNHIFFVNANANDLSEQDRQKSSIALAI